MTGKEKPKIDIRYASAEDNELLAEFGAKTFWDAFAAQNTPENMRAYIESAFSPEKQAAEIADPDSIFLIAEIESELAGYARLLKGPAPPNISGEHPIELVRIYASQAWIGHGVGSTLMQDCIEEAKKQGCDMLWLGVWELNPRAQAFYRKWGFEETGTQIFHLGDEAQRDLLFQRPIETD